MTQVHQILEKGVLEGGFPGATFAYGGLNQVTSGAVGRMTFDDDSPPVHVDTLYDLASLTKVLATTPLALAAVRRGALTLDTRVGDVLPNAGAADACIHDLLTHSSGLPPYDHPLSEAGFGPDETRAKVISTQPVARPGEQTAYSCLGFIVLATVLEHVLGEQLDFLFERLVAEPMGLKSVGYLPPAKPAPAPTDPRLPVGIVHDPLARALGGVSGNAGLFGSVSAVAHVAQWWLRANTEVSEWTKRQSQNSSRALGWDTKSGEGSSAGRLFGPRSFGHTGYTGTSLWIDPDDMRFVALLTNRVYPDDTSIAMQWARPEVADASKSAGT